MPSDQPIETDHHDHSHTLGHVHAPANFGRAFAIGVTLNLLFVVTEVVYGLRSNSLALVADAGHNFGDVLGLVAAWVASLLVMRAPTQKHTYGFKRSPILAALINAALLLVATGAIIWEAIRRLETPEPVEGNIVMAVAAVGIAINLGTALMFASGRKGDLNVRGAFVHMTGDAAVAFGVVIAGFAIKATHLLWIDPIVSILVAALVLWASWKLLVEGLNMAMDAVPPTIDIAAVREYLGGLPGVKGLHDLHIWSMSTTESALTVHLVMPDGASDDFLLEACSHLHGDFNIGHPTIQIEKGDGNRECPLASEAVV